MASIAPTAEAVAPWQMQEAGRRVLWSLTGYTPWPEQLAAHLDTSRIRLVVGGERAGKSLWTGEEKAGWVFVAPSGAIFWIVGPSYELARPEFKYIIPALGQMGLLDTRQLSMPRYGSCRLVTRSGVVVETRTSHDVETLAGEAPHGIAMVEAAQQTYESFLRLRGRVAETRGPLILSGTFEGSLGWYPELWKAGQSDNTDGVRSFSIPSWANRTIYPLGRQDPEIKALEATFPADVFQERFGAVPCPPATLVFKEFSHLTHVRPCPFDDKLSVQLWIDPGYAHRYAVQAVQIDYYGEVLHIDEIWETGLVTSQMIQIARRREWWPKVQFAVMCMGGRQHQAMESPAEVWQQEAGIPVFSEPVPIADGIERHRTYLINPATGKSRMFYDPKCKGSIWEYGHYKYHEIVEARPVREVPIDADNDALKATAYGLVHNFGFVGRRPIQDVQVVFRTRRGERVGAGMPSPESWGGG